MYQLKKESSKEILLSLVEMDQILAQEARNKSIYDNNLSF